MNNEIKNLYEATLSNLHKNIDLSKGYERSLVSCGMLTTSGNIYLGVNLPWWHSVCAEPVALGSAMSNGEREIKYCIAIKLNRRNNNIEVVSPCGICREMFKELQPNIKIIVKRNEELVAVNLVELLPEN